MREDFGQRAKRIADIATGQQPRPNPEPTGKQLGGEARMD